MIHITFSEPITKEWLNWKQRCKKATLRLIEDVRNGIAPKFTPLYKEQKSVYFDRNSNFFGKCAYCESLITSNQPGDIEHFRPKGTVTDSDDAPIIITDQNGSKYPHPGYYWLAYHFSNLLPSCSDCNRPSRGNSGGNKIGKWNQFPVKDTHATKPEEEAKEFPLLINPVTENPEDYLEIDSLGIILPKDERGKKCIEVLGLNIRPSLVEERKSIYDTVKGKYLLVILALKFQSIENVDLSEIQSYLRGSKPYSMSGRKAIFDTENMIQSLSNKIHH